MRVRQQNICAFCGEIIESIHRKVKDDFVGDTFMGYEDHVCKPENIKFHFENIVCPECDREQLATVEHTFPFFTYIHECVGCGYTIMESEWEKVVPQFFEPE